MGRSLRGRFSGVVRYTHDLVHALAPTLASDLTVFVTQAEDGLDGTGVRRIRAPFRTPNEYARAFWEQSIVPLEVARLKPDVYHSPNYMLPVAVRCPTVVTVHDLTFLDAAAHRLRSHLYLTVMTSLAVRKATRIICVSQYTRDRLVERFHGVEERTRIVGEGLDPRFQPQSRTTVERFMARHHLAAPYVLFIGTIEPRKNLVRLISAFTRAIQETGSAHHLVIGGASGWKEGPVRAAHDASPLHKRIHFIGYVPEGDLPAAYTGADLFAYPSLCEGFGLPPLEAMGCGTAILTSRLSSLPEVVGDAALAVDPFSVTAIADGLATLMTDPVLRTALANAGLQRAAVFRGMRWLPRRLPFIRRQPHEARPVLPLGLSQRGSRTRPPRAYAA